MTITNDLRNKEWLVVHTASVAEDWMVWYNCLLPLYDIVRKQWHIRCTDLDLLECLVPDLEKLLIAL